jgi:hypothetical protein
MTRNRSPLRYFPAHLMDVVQGPFALFATVSVGLCFILWRMSRGEAVPFDAASFIPQAMSVVLTVSVLVASGGVAGGDIANGFYRAWFSKPIAPWWFYLQRWLLGGVAVLCIPLLLGAGLQLLFGGAWGVTRELLLTIALGYLLVGGTVLLLSSFTAKDWLVTFLLGFAQARIHDVMSLMEMTKSEPPAAIEWAHRLLPPFHLISPMKGLPEGNDLIHVAAYGAGMVAVALILFVVKPLGSGGRA